LSYDHHTDTEREISSSSYSAKEIFAGSWPTENDCNNVLIIYARTLIWTRAMFRAATLRAAREAWYLDGQVKSLGFAALMLIRILMVVTLSGERSNAQFLSHDHPLEAGEIKLGMSNAQTGRLGFLGTAVRQGCLAYLSRANKEGGVSGRRLVLVDYDDRYEPIEAVSNTERLIDRDKVFALLNFLGTPTCRSIMPMLNEAHIVLVGPVSGAVFLRQPMQPLIFNTRPSYEEEAEMLVAHLISDLGCKRIALFRQDDSYGDAGRIAVVDALHRRGLQLVGEGDYVRNSVRAPDAVYRIAKSKPDAVILFGTYKPCADFIRESKKIGLQKTVFCNVSFVGTEPLIKYLAEDGDGVIISQVVPSPFDQSLPLVRDYQTDMRSVGETEFSYMSLEGYVNTLTMVTALRRAGPDLTEDALIHSLENLNIDFRLFSIHFSPDTRQGAHQVFLTKIDHGRSVPIEKLDPADFAR
jgi:branched-chain amino acid transport system substrate-binding protein